MDSAEFHAAVYDAVRSIPPDHVTTYGHIAKLIGMPNHSRHVGQALKFLTAETNPPVPWHRVISSSGIISSRGPGTTGALHQRDALIAEGIQVNVGRSGDMRVDLRRYGWFPSPDEYQAQVQIENGNGNEDDDDDREDGINEDS